MASSSSDASGIGTKRHEELLALRNDNAHRERRFYGASADKEIVKEPVYDVKVLDRVVTRVAREIRLLEQALKATNAKTTVDAYNQTTGPCNGLHCWWFRREIVGGAEARERRRDVVTPLVVSPDRGPLAFPSI